ncbi:tRNA (adenosine(37)-N6)-threonylcarbamoyltransferase complex dimerization subunit type 1 TsaB [Pontibacter akesuensis]|uniref:tRNA threonylcarbamoyladenosine biosynthesis protein TsaB n=1 Tax=Pontibacter akesuensis TaxID=388950 RepID=A0A1I7INJ6_9BACT|nr:tRNA (adenosine(37)-N6)-threonylcarbamoyltransferase complex dimerization subunit type 1 TsaB [Pontibacter akesuensis]GHA68023.1 tRNA (adenosine(37)-N6)-threonylcarbamoyltransferase complex dimerization subunit type 1 TsaB [Pontibacter akesuensis]SFU74535.1 tRNA threonylcarbamoyladenosine biosynthesis protein TsaB [Pontibacter akesuensis]
MPLLLALETSTTVCSIALFKGQQLLGASELQIEKSHSSHITVMIAQLVENCGATLHELSAVAVSGGPGSYTGLRIGTSTAKGLCFSLNIPLLEVSTLHGLAAQVTALTPNPERFLFCPMLDARRLEVYTCLLDHTLKEVLPIAPVVLEENTFAGELQERPVIFFGSGAGKFREMVNTKENALFVEGVLPNAKTIGELALAKYEQKAFEDVAYYEPFYLKDVYITSAGKSTK